MKDFGLDGGMVNNHVELCKTLKLSNPTIFDVGGNQGLILAEYCRINQLLGLMNK